MRRAAKVDDNQDEIVKALRGCGCSVQVSSSVGQGFPDLVVGVADRNYLLEVKDPSKPKRDQRLTGDQERWHKAWTGQKAVVRSADEALRVVGLI